MAQDPTRRHSRSPYRCEYLVDRATMPRNDVNPTVPVGRRTSARYGFIHRHYSPAEPRL